MNYYPICLKIEGRPCLVVGGGKVASRKVEGLLAAGARVTVISPELSDGLARLRDEGAIVWQPRGYQVGDGEGYFLLMAATDDPAVQDLVQADAERLQSLVNVADVPEKCNFILPAVVKRGALSIAISTSGKSPALAKKLRRELTAWLGQEYALLTEVMGLLRPYVLVRGLAQAANEAIFMDLLEGGALDAIRKADWPGLKECLERGLNQALAPSLAEELKKLLGR